MNVNPAIFREYDVRGIVDQDLTDEFAELLGKAFGTYQVQRERTQLAVGRDVRASSTRFRDALIRGLVSTGCEVIDVGVCPTPLLYFALFHYERSGGVMITGSHNPPEFNGFKICSGKSTIHGGDIQELLAIAQSGNFASGEGSVREAEIIDPYIAWVKGNVRIQRPVKVVVDAGNGTAGVVAPRMLEALGQDVIPLFCEPDATFPNHHPDPTIPENLEALIDKVHETGAELGIGYDGDGDRIGVVTGRGKILWGDMLMVLFSREILRGRPGATIVAEVKCSQNLYDDIAARGGNGIMWKAGHSPIKAKMREVGAALGGEMSGHVFFADRFFGFDDALYATLRVLEIVAREERTLDELLSDLPPLVATPEIRIDCPDDKKFEVVRRAVEHFKTTHTVVDVDGARVLFEDGWALVRASNTQPVLVLRFEAKSQERLDAIRGVVEDILRSLSDG